MSRSSRRLYIDNNFSSLNVGLPVESFPYSRYPSSRRVALRRYRAFVLNVVSYEYLVYRVRMNAFHRQTRLRLVNQLVEPFNEHVNVCIYE